MNKEVTVDSLKIGKRYFTWDSKGPVEIRILGPVVDMFIAIDDITNYKTTKIFPGDLGLKPAKYDRRPAQVFFTREECKAAIKSWKGTHPNFIQE